MEWLLLMVCGFVMAGLFALSAVSDQKGIMIITALFMLLFFSGSGHIIGVDKKTKIINDLLVKHKLARYTVTNGGIPYLVGKDSTMNMLIKEINK